MRIVVLDCSAVQATGPNYGMFGKAGRWSEPQAREKAAKVPLGFWALIEFQGLFV